MLNKANIIRVFTIVTILGPENEHFGKLHFGRNFKTLERAIRELKKDIYHGESHFVMQRYIKV